MKYFSMFSGIGGFELGLDKAILDFESVGASEVDIYAKSIYIRHFPKHRQWGDATKIKAEELPEFDFLVGGFPCQAFSIAGERKGFDDTRGTLFFEIVRILEEKRPKYFLLENVKGLLSHNGGNTFTRMLRILSELGYYVEWEIINSKLFVPQNRERIYLKGYLGEECGREIFHQQRSCREASCGVDVEMKWSPSSTRVSKFVDSDGVGLTPTGEGQNCGRNQLITVNEGKAQAQKVYDEDGIATTLCGCGGGQGGKTGLYKIGNKIVRGVELDNGDIATTTTTGESFAVTTRNRQNNLDKKMDNYVISKVGVGDNSEKSEIKKVGSVAANGYWGKNVYDPDGICPSLCSGSLQKNGTRIIENEPLKLKTNTTKGYDEAYEGDSVRLCHPTSKTARGRVQGDNSGALSSSNDWGVVDKDFRIRRLTPTECERLQGFPDGWTKYGKDGELISDTQRYKCLGNAVTVDVVTHIVDCMFGALI